MVATWSPAANSGYYTQQVEYYFDASAPVGTWHSPSGQFDLVDGSTVQRATFEALFNGFSVDGTRLHSQARSDRVPAFDVTLSAPRSVSLMWAFGDPATRAAVEQAQSRAVRTTLDLLEREAAYARRGHGGARVERVPLSAACFRHGDSRPADHTDGKRFADPNLHTHCVILNLARRADGSIGALHSKMLRDWKMAAGATYHAALAHGLQQMGLAIDRVGKNGIFEIAGVSPTIIEYFSARRRDIEDELASAGTSSGESAALAAHLAKVTRSGKGKVADPDRDRVEQWFEAAKMNGFAPDRLEQQGREAAQHATQTLPTPTERWASLPDELTATDSVIERRELLRASAASLVGTGCGPEVVAEQVDRWISEGRFVHLGNDALGQHCYSTPEMIRTEHELVETAGMLAQAPWRPLEGSVLARQCRQHGLTQEQTAATMHAGANQRLAVIEGAPGSGKTTTLAPLVEAYRAAGCRIVGAASAWRMAHQLRDDLGIEAKAIAAWLAQAERRTLDWDARTLVVVDEAGLLSSREMHTILGAVKRSGAKLLLVGDRDQLQAIGAGPGLTLVTQLVAQARVNTIVRQHAPWAREAVTAIGQGRADAALDAYAARGLWLERAGTRAAIRTLVDHWERQRREHPDASTLLLAKTNADITAISREVRTRLHANGALTGPEIEFSAVTPSGHSTELRLAAGDQIRFLTRHDGLGVVNGTTGTVLRVWEAQTRAGRTQQLVANVRGRRITFRPGDLADAQGRARLGWAYASTIYGAQGLTVDHAAVLLNSTFDRHDGYVAASRARTSTLWVTDQLRLERELRAWQGPAPTTSGHGSEPITPEERRGFLASRLSRSTPKRSTLDIADLALAEDLVQRQAQHGTQHQLHQKAELDLAR